MAPPQNHTELSVLLALKWARWHRARLSTAHVHCCVREKNGDGYYCIISRPLLLFFVFLLLLVVVWCLNGNCYFSIYLGNVVILKVIYLLGGKL